ncbi:hypothetical protein SS53G_2208 [Shigella sonnei 53G]|nr:hypothetical protein SS53G_2208 [Shigella sonnei 53G]
MPFYFRKECPLNSGYLNGQYDTQQKGYRSEYSRHNEFIQKVSHRQCAKEAQGADFSRKRPK